MPSYETRINVLEDKLAFCMQLQTISIRIDSPLDPTSRVVQCSLADLWAQVKAAGGRLVPDAPAPAAPVVDAEVVSEAN